MLQNKFPLLKHAPLKRLASKYKHSSNKIQ